MLVTKEKPATVGAVTGKAVEAQVLSHHALTSIAYLIVIVITLAALFWPQPTRTVEKTYTVRIGETIWHIANDVKAQGDVREVDEIVWQIEKDNKVNKYVYPGDVLTVQMKLKEDK